MPRRLLGTGSPPGKSWAPDRLGLALLFVLVAAPVVFSLVYALLYSLGLTGLLSDGFTLTHWQAVLSSGEIWSSFGLSLYVAVSTMVLTVGLALALSLGWREPLRSGPLSTLIYLPLALPGAVAAFFTLQVLSGGGLLARVLAAVGMVEEPAAMVSLVHDRLAIGIVVAHVIAAVPFFTLLFVQLYDTERIAELRRLAVSLGASRWQTVVRVALPVLLYRASTNLVLYFIWVLGSFEIPLLLGRQAPQMLSVVTYRKFSLFDLLEKPQAYVVALMYTLLVFVLLGIVFGRQEARS